MDRRRTAFTHVVSSLRHAITCTKLLPACDRILVALSGGQDSLALAESLRHLHKKQRWQQLSLIHCDHRWPHDVGIADFVQRYANDVNLPLHIIDAAKSERPVGMTEGSAREWRYAELAEVSQRLGYNCVVTAHTRTDLAETVLFNLAHGAGADGLSALTWERPLCEGVSLVRPFLNVSRHDTAAFCKERGLQVWCDHYNEDSRYARNRIRAEVMPVLKVLVNRHVEEALARTAHLLRDETIHLENETEIMFKKVIISNEEEIREEHKKHKQRNRDFFKRQRVDASQQNSFVSSATRDEATRTASDTVIVLDRKVLERTSVALQRRIIRRVLQKCLGLSHDGSTFAQVEAVRSLIHADVGTSTASLCGNASAVATDDKTITLKSPRRVAIGTTFTQETRSTGDHDAEGSSQDLQLVKLQ